MTGAGRAAVVAALAGLVLGAGGCDGGESTGPQSPLAECDQLTAAPAGAGVAAGGGEPLPDLSLPCFTGGEPFPLAELRGPAVVNLWASWCGPCREELPALQQYADRAAGQVHVLGVVTEDRWAAAAALATDLGLRFPALDDPDARLNAELGTFALPVTLFVDAAGRVRHVHRTGALDREELARLVRDHLGVAA